MDMTWQRLSKR